MYKYLKYNFTLFSIISSIFASFSYAATKLPWSVNDKIYHGWSPKRILRHSEYIHITLERDNEQIVIELIPKKIGMEDEWCTRCCRLQPVKGANVNEMLLRHMLEDLKQWEESGLYSSLFNANTYKTINYKIRLTNSQYIKFLINYILAIILFFIIIYYIIVYLNFLRKEIIIICIIMSIVAITFILVGSNALPTQWITVLREGMTKRNVFHLYGIDNNIGPAFNLILKELGQIRFPVIKSIVHVNLFLAIINTLIFYLIGRYILDNRWEAILFSMLFGFNLNFIHSALSRSPTQILTLYFLLSVINITLMNNFIKDDKLKLVALSFLIILTYIAYCTREEIGGVGAIAVFFSTLNIARNSTRKWPVILKIKYAFGKITNSSKWLKIILIILTLILLECFIRFLKLYTSLMDRPPWSWILDGFQPLDVSMISIILDFLTFLPIGLVCCSIVGFLFSLNRIGQFCGFPVAALIICKMYMSASAGIKYQSFRYLATITPWLVFLALIGWREFYDLLQKRFKNKDRKLILSIIMLLFIPFYPFNSSTFYDIRNMMKGEFKSRDILISRNLQKEVRFLVKQVEKYPDCVFVTRTSTADHRVTPLIDYDLVFFGKPLPEPISIRDQGIPIDQIIDDIFPETKCVLFYYSLDCQLINADGCKDYWRKWPVLDREVFSNLSYSGVKEYGQHCSVINLELYQVK